MKNILIVLICVAIGGAGAFFATGSVTKKLLNAERDKEDALHPRETSDIGSGDSHTDYLVESQRLSGEIARSLKDNEVCLNYATIGGGVGLAAGFLVALGLIRILERHKKAMPSRQSVADQS